MRLNKDFMKTKYGLFRKEKASLPEEKGGGNLPPSLMPTCDDLSRVASEDSPIPVMLPIWPGKGIQFLKQRRPKPFMYLTDEDLEEYKKEQEEWEEWQKEWNNTIRDNSRLR
jgi:hypothetical protein